MKASLFLGGLIKFAGGIFKLRIMMIFMIIFILSAAMVSIQEKDPNAGIEDLAERWSKPTLKLQEESQRIVDNQGIKKKDGSPGTLFTFLGVFWNLLSPLFIIYMWLLVIFRILSKWFGENVADFNLFVFAVLLFLIIQSFWLLFNGQYPWQPFIAFKTFIFQATPYVISPLASVADSFQGKEEEIIQDVVNGTADMLQA